MVNRKKNENTNEEEFFWFVEKITEYSARKTLGVFNWFEIQANFPAVN